MRYADLDDKILLYDNEQTDAINKNTTDIENIKDSIIDSGSNANGSWEKWESGKLIQQTSVVVTLNSAGFQDYNLPTNFIGDYTPLCSPRQTPIKGNQTVWWDNIHKVVTVPRFGNVARMLYRGEMSDTEGTFDVYLVGRWK